MPSCLVYLCSTLIDGETPMIDGYVIVCNFLEHINDLRRQFQGQNFLDPNLSVILQIFDAFYSLMLFAHHLEPSESNCLYGQVTLKCQMHYTYFSVNLFAYVRPLCGPHDANQDSLQLIKTTLKQG